MIRLLTSLFRLPRPKHRFIFVDIISERAFRNYRDFYCKKNLGYHGFSEDDPLAAKFGWEISFLGR